MKYQEPINLIRQVWHVGNPRPVFDDDDRYCDYCNKRTQKYLVPIGLKDIDTGVVGAVVRHAGSCCAKRIQHGAPAADKGMKPYPIWFYSIRDQKNKLITSFRVNQRSEAETYAIKVGGRVVYEKGWEQRPDSLPCDSR